MFHISTNFRNHDVSRYRAIGEENYAFIVVNNIGVCTGGNSRYVTLKEGNGNRR